MNTRHLGSKAWGEKNLKSGNDKMMCKCRWRRDDEAWGSMFLKARGKSYCGVGAGIKGSVWNLRRLIQSSLMSYHWCWGRQERAEQQVAVSREQNTNTGMLLITEKLSPKLAVRCHNPQVVNTHCEWKGRGERGEFPIAFFSRRQHARITKSLGYPQLRRQGGELKPPRLPWGEQWWGTLR